MVPEARSADTVHAEHKEEKKLVTVTLITIDPETGEEVAEEKQIAKGKTVVAVVKQELDVPAELSLWVIGKNGRRKRLADHDVHDVKKGDQFVVIRPGGVS
jgi:hypothetical protein